MKRPQISEKVAVSVPPSEDKWYTVREVAKQVGLSHQQVARLRLRNGWFPHAILEDQSVGYLYPEQDVLDFIAQYKFRRNQEPGAYRDTTGDSGASISAFPSYSGKSTPGRLMKTTLHADIAEQFARVGLTLDLPESELCPLNCRYREFCPPEDDSPCPLIKKGQD